MPAEPNAANVTAWRASVTAPTADNANECLAKRVTEFQVTRPTRGSIFGRNLGLPIAFAATTADLSRTYPRIVNDVGYSHGISTIDARHDDPV